MQRFLVRQLSFTRRCVALAAAIWLSGCALADQFGTRAVTYNIESETARDQNIILNVIRAAYRKPMQFTDVGTASGTATATGTVGSSLLIGPHQSASASSLSPGFTFAGGPTFTMSTLDTKEFYAGILSPIDKSLINYYASIRIPGQVLYTMLVSEIDVDGPAGNVLNHATTQDEWNSFQQVLNALLDAGLTTELRDPEYYGPELSARSLSDPAKLAALAKEKIDLVPDKSAKSVWHAVKDDPKPSFCFDPKTAPKTVDLGKQIIRIPDSALCGQHESTKKSGVRPETLTSKTLLPGVTVKIRSIEGVIYFLGEIVRSELGLDRKHPVAINPWLRFRTPEGGGWQTDTDILFSLHPGRDAESITTSYDSQTYSMPVDPSNTDHSAQVLEFVAQLLALSSSSKDLPAPGVITLIGH